MSKFSRKSIALLCVIAGSSLAVFAATASGGTAKHSANAEIAVLLPDTQSSVRWETADRPALAAAFKKAGLTYNIVKRHGGEIKVESRVGEGTQFTVLLPAWREQAE